MNPELTHITGEVIWLNVDSGPDGTVVNLLVDEHPDGEQDTPLDQCRALELRLPAHAVEHLSSQYGRYVNLHNLYTIAASVARWLDQHNGVDQAETAARLMKVGEEFGEVAAAWIGVTGQNPRKTTEHTIQDVGRELADVVIAAVVAMISCGLPAELLIAERAEGVAARIADSWTPAPLRTASQDAAGQAEQVRQRDAALTAEGPWPARRSEVRA